MQSEEKQYEDIIAKLQQERKQLENQNEVLKYKSDDIQSFIEDLASESE